MELNADFSKRAVVHAADLEWIPSPMAGVDRRMLDRLGDEVARATSIVRYAPGSSFSPHTHTGGEEFLVLDGVFSDEHGDFPAGSYIRNPPESSHTPSSEPGCTIFVKLWQFDPKDRQHVRADTSQNNYTAHPDHSGVMIALLYSDAHEDVRMERWAAGTEVSLEAPEGLELLVVEGSMEEAGEAYKPQSWLRLPKGSESTAIAGPKGALVWTKRNHLATPPRAPSSS